VSLQFGPPLTGPPSDNLTAPSPRSGPSADSRRFNTPPFLQPCRFQTSGPGEFLFSDLPLSFLIQLLFLSLFVYANHIFLFPSHALLRFCCLFISSPPFNLLRRRSVTVPRIVPEPLMPDNGSKNFSPPTCPENPTLFSPPLPRVCFHYSPPSQIHQRLPSDNVQDSLFSFSPHPSNTKLDPLPFFAPRPLFCVPHPIRQKILPLFLIFL